MRKSAKGARSSELLNAPTTQLSGGPRAMGKASSRGGEKNAYVDDAGGELGVCSIINLVPRGPARRGAGVRTPSNSSVMPRKAA